MLATGNVHLIQGDREAACGRAEVLPEQEKVILSEHPVIVDHDQNTRAAGKKITMLRGQRQVLIDEPILTAPPVKDLGVDKPLPPAVAPKQP
jgi:lipopolysaccharide export system protein LptA